MCACAQERMHAGTRTPTPPLCSPSMLPTRKTSGGKLKGYSYRLRRELKEDNAHSLLCRSYLPKDVETISFEKSICLNNEKLAIFMQNG